MRVKSTIVHKAIKAGGSSGRPDLWFRITTLRGGHAKCQHDCQTRMSTSEWLGSAGSLDLLGWKRPEERRVVQYDGS